MRFLFIPTLIFSSSLLVSSFPPPISFDKLKELAKLAVDQKIAWREGSDQKTDNATCCVITAYWGTRSKVFDTENEEAYEDRFSVEPTEVDPVSGASLFTIFLLDGREKGAMEPSQEWNQPSDEQKKTALVDAFNAQHANELSDEWEFFEKRSFLTSGWPKLVFKWKKPAAATKTSFRASNSDRDQKLEQVNQINRVLLKEMELLQRK